MEFLQIPYEDFKTFFLILIRVSVILFLFPFFSSRIIPNMVKAGLVFIIALILFPVTEIGPMAFPDKLLGFVRLIMGELIIGMTLGLMVQVFFEGVRIMGQLVGFQTGFAIANILDPQSGMRISIFSNMAYYLAMVIFLILNGHHMLLNAIKQSFDVINLGSLDLNENLKWAVVQKAGDMFILAIKLGAPAIAALLFVKVAFGLITKFIPQMHIMIVAFPIQIVIGLIFFGLSFNVLLRFVERYISNLSSLLMGTMSLMGV